MKELNLCEAKQIMLDILCEIDRFCAENSIQYFLVFGTLIGAIRHQGFIPWDDDIDIAMPREDYDKFIKNFSTDGKYRIVDYNNTENYYLAFAKVIDSSTLLIEDVATPVKLGIYVDVFPLDYLGNTYNDAFRQYKKLKLYREFLSAKSIRTHKKRKWYRNALSTIVYYSPFSRKLIISKLEKVAKSKQKGKYISYAVNMVYGPGDILETEWFENQVDVTFEGRIFKAPADYHKILTHVYGDYMKLPSEDKRVTHHSMKAWRIEN